MDIMLVLNMQKTVFETPRYNHNRVLTNINQLSDKIHTDQGIVIFIKHSGTKENHLEPLSEGWKFLPELQVTEQDFVIEKKTSDAFFETKLLKMLQQFEPEQLLITGCATDICMDTTIHSAIFHGFHTIVISDAHTTADRETIPAKTIIKHYNWTWENQLLPNHTLQVMTMKQYLHANDPQDD